MPPTLLYLETAYAANYPKKKKGKDKKVYCVLVDQSEDQLAINPREDLADRKTSSLVVFMKVLVI